MADVDESNTVALFHSSARAANAVAAACSSIFLTADRIPVLQTLPDFENHGVFNQSFEVCPSRHVHELVAIQQHPAGVGHAVLVRIARQSSLLAAGWLPA